MAQAPPAWSKIADAAKHLEMRYSDDMVYERPGRSGEIHLVWNFKLAGNSRLMIRTELSNGSSADEDVEACNSEYEFTLKRTRSDRPWLVTHVGTDLTERHEEIAEEWGADFVAQSALHVGFVSFPEIFQSPDFTIKDVGIVDRAGDSLVSVMFEFSPSGKSAQDRWPRAGVVMLNPERMWAVESFDVELSAYGRSEKLSQHIEYNSTGGGVPVIKRIVTTREETPDAPGHYQRTWDFDTFEYRDIPESEFTLAAFGLPEIAPPSMFQRYRLFVLLFVAGIVCIAVAAIIYRRSSTER